MKRSKTIKSFVLLLAAIALSASQLLSLIVPVVFAATPTDTAVPVKKTLCDKDFVNQYVLTTNWLSGNVLGAIPTIFDTVSVANNKPAEPKKETAKKATSNKPMVSSLQKIVVPTATSNTTQTTTSSVTPTTAPSTSTSPTGAENLVVNPSFEDMLGDWARTWEKNGADFVIDTTSHGDNGANSLFIASTGTGAYVYSNTINVQSGTTYVWMQYVYTIVAGEEFGFYIDEYDADGNWLSGQWKGRLDPQDAGTTVIRKFSYTPSSEQVKHVKLQYYSNADDQTVAYIDSVFFGK